MNEKLVWSSNMTRDNLLSLTESAKKDALLDRDYDSEMLEGADLDQVIGNDKYMWQEDLQSFDTEILPMIEDQTKEGMVVVMNEDECYVMPVEELTGPYNSSYNDYDLKDKNGDLYWVNNGVEYELFAIPEDYDFDEDNGGESLEDPQYVLQNCDHIQNLADLDLGEDLTEAKASDPEELRKELDEIKPLVDEYGFQYFTSMPFSNFEDDHESIEYQYPEFAEQVKSFYKEMGLLSPEEIADSDVMDEHWEVDMDEHDFNTILNSCEKMANNMSVQYEKEFKKGFDNGLKSDKEILADREQEEEVAEESLNEDVNIDKLKETIADEFYETYLMGIDDNYAQEAAAKWPQYDLDWCNVEGDNLMAQEVDEAKYNLARTIVKSLFANAPQNESLVEGPQDNNKEIEDVIWDAISNAAYNLEVEKEIHLDKEVFRNIVNKVIDRFMVDDEFDESLNEKFSASLAGEHKGSNEDKFGEGCKDKYYGYIGVDHPTLGKFTISVGIDGDVRTDGRPWEFLQEEEYQLTPEQAEFVMKHKNKFAEMARNDIPNETFREDFDESLNEGLSHDAKKVIFDTFEYYDDGEGWDPSGYIVLFNDIVNNASDIVKKELLSKKQEVMSYIDKLATYEFDGPTYEFDALNYDTSLNEEDMEEVPSELDLGDGIVLETDDQETMDMIQDILADAPKDESLNEDTLTEPQGDSREYTRTVDWVTEATTEGELIDEIRSFGLPSSGDGLKGIKITVDSMMNDANGWATVTFTGDKETIDQFLEDAGFED